MKKRTIMVLAVMALLVSSVAFAYGPGHKSGGSAGWMDMDCDGDFAVSMGRRDRDGQGRHREMTAEKRTRMEAFRKARLELQLALAERPLDGKKVADLQDRVDGLRWSDGSVPETIRGKMAELRRSALELKLILSSKPVDEQKATSLHERMLSLRGEIARWRLSEKIGAANSR